MDPHAHFERIQRAHAEATRRGEEVIYVERWRIDEIDPLTFFEVISAPSPARAASEVFDAQYLWVAPHAWFVGIGSALTERVDGLRDAQESDILARLDAMCSDDTSRELLRMVGGAAFDPEERHGDDARWRGYGPGVFWAPRQMVSGGPGHWWAMINLVVRPEDRQDELKAQLTRQREVLEAWCDGARTYEPATSNATLAGQIVEPGVIHWETLVDETAGAIRDGVMEKVVLARPMEFEAHDAEHLSPHRILRQLHEDYPSCSLFALRPPRLEDEEPSLFLGATPECLVRVDEGGDVYVDALAGTASPDVEDAALLASDKDRHEHQLVVDTIREGIAALVDDLDVPDVPDVDVLANVKHLRTPIRASTQEGVLRLAAQLHPTPAVCGRPFEDAMRWIRERERRAGFARGWYAGAIGWMGLDGQGQLDVALRCALLEAERAVLFAGAGIVGDSTGVAEVRETRIKANALARSITTADARKAREAS